MNTRLFKSVIRALQHSIPDDILVPKVYDALLSIFEKEDDCFTLDAMVGTDNAINRAVLIRNPGYFDEYFEKGVDPTDWSDSTSAVLEAYNIWKSRAVIATDSY